MPFNTKEKRNEYMKKYYATNKEQHEKHKVLVNENKKKVKNGE